MENTRIGIVGIGGVGGYVAGMLAKTYENVTFVARGARKESIENNGLILHSEYKGEIVARPKNVVSSSDQLGEQDVIFVCVKNYSLEEACGQLKDVVTENTIVVPIMNGADVGERTRAYLGKGIVVDSLVYIIAFANPDYSILHKGMFADIKLGAEKEAEKKAAQRVWELLKNADIDAEFCEDIQAAIWKKYIFNCAYNVLSAFYDNNVGQLRSDPAKAEEFEALAREAFAVCQAKKINVPEEYVDEVLHRFNHVLAADATSSLQRDYRDGKPVELETFGGYIVKEAERLGMEVPVSKKMYEGLKNGTNSVSRG